jgi:pilus assembly protein Flp/PilA
MFKIIRKLRKNDEGATAIEYALIAALISVAAILAMQALGTSLSNMFGGVSTSLDANAPATAPTVP